MQQDQLDEQFTHDALHEAFLDEIAGQHVTVEGLVDALATIGFGVVTMPLNMPLAYGSSINTMVSGLDDQGNQVSGWGRAWATANVLLPVASVYGGEIIQAGIQGYRGLTLGMEGVEETSLLLGSEEGFATDLGRFFYDDRSFRTISREYWAENGPADGSSLHHWLFPQSATWVPQGIRNAGFNLMELPPIIDTPFGGLNQWMGMSRSPWAPVIDWGIRIGVPASIGGAAYGGAQLGAALSGDPYH